MQPVTGQPLGSREFIAWWLASIIIATCGRQCLAQSPSAARFHNQVQPILETYCYGCHGYGSSEGGRTLDEFASDEAMLADRDLWWAVLKNVGAGLMPPAGEERPSAHERRTIREWIKADVFGIDPNDPDPGRVTIRRLNRVEYRNTIRDLMGVDYDTELNFPPDDSGYGFDNIGDALSLSPLLMEKYIAAAESIVAEAVPANHEMVDGRLPEGYARFFPGGQPPEDEPARGAYAHRLLREFAGRAFRRPVDDATVERLAGLAESVYGPPGSTFEQGIAQAMVAVLASPRFLYRVEEAGGLPPGRTHPWVDEYALASRLSYFLWSTMPDAELMDLAARGELRANLRQQVQRMLADDRSDAFVQNFAGQWLGARDVETFPIDALEALGLARELEAVNDELDSLDQQDHEPDTQTRRQQLIERRDELTSLRDSFGGGLRWAMRRETEMTVEYVMDNDRSVLELLDSNYTFLNDTLAKLYGIPGVEGDWMRRVTLPADSPRGGVLTQGTLLVVTSNPTRTSPVKRGQFILENILGTPAPPPPAAVPTLEASAAAITDHEPTLREALELHRSEPLCAGCHSRMDPLGLALENFTALGTWRDTERGQPIDASGTLITGEAFDGVRELKRILKSEHRLDFYRCLTEKLLTYAVGRGLEPTDQGTDDEIVERLDEHEGRFSALLWGVIESAPFQQRRRASASDAERAARHGPIENDVERLR